MRNRSVECEIAGAIADNAWMTAAHAVQVTLCTATVIAVVYVFVKRKISMTTMHVNLKMRYHTYTDPCSLLFPRWMSIAVISPFYVYFVACPCWHLATTLERIYATYKAQWYEKTSAAYGIWSSVVVWFASLSYVVYVVYLALMDEEFQKPQPAMGLTFSTNATFILRTHYVTLVADLLTSFADFLILRQNLRMLNSVLPSYSLSRSYQTNENIVVTTRLVLPLSLSNTAFYVVYLLAASWSRHVYNEIIMEGPTPNSLLYRRAVCGCDWILTLLMLQMLVSVLVFLRFCKRRPRTVSIAKKSEEYEIYDQQIRQHW